MKNQIIAQKISAHYLWIYCIVVSTIPLFFSCKQSPNFSTHIAPIIYKNCTPCHRPNQIGHFNLISYKDVSSKSTAILFAVKSKMMPPWPADAHYSRFANEMLLTEDEIKTIEQWVAAKCPSGDTSQLPPLPQQYNNSLLGKPDMSIAVQPQLISSNYTDKFLLVKVPFELPQEMYAHSIEFVPGNTKVVHHVNADLVKYDEDKKQNVFDGNYVHNTILDSTVRLAYKAMGLLHDDGSYPTLHRNAMNYLPGVIAQRFPGGIGDIALGRKNAFLLSDLHYGPSGQQVWDSSYINIFFSKAPPQRVVEEFQLGTLGISPVLPSLVLPPNKISNVYSMITLPQTISVIMLNPHMHLLGKSFKGFAVKPNGDTVKLISIPRWDFNWQNYYKPKHPIVLEKGTAIFATGVYDNTSNNPHNPYKPPREVSDKNGSMRTTDEMFQFIISYMPYQAGDENLDLDAE